jgi:hypothetical protein
MNVYENNGFANREEYLDSLAEEYGDMVYGLADLLGPNEDFDGLVTTLEDFADMG